MKTFTYQIEIGYVVMLDAKFFLLPHEVNSFESSTFLNVHESVVIKNWCLILVFLNIEFVDYGYSLYSIGQKIIA